MSNYNQRDNRRKGNKPAGRDGKGINIPVILLIVILILLASFGYLIWKFEFGGIKVHYDPDYEPEISMDAEDIVLIPQAEDRASYVDDGKETILCIGNDVFSEDRDTSDSLANMISMETGADVINVAFPGTTIAYANAGSAEALDMYSFVNVAKAINSGDYQAMTDGAGTLGEDFIKSMDTLRSVDFSKVDTICIMYYGTDYLKGRGLYDPNDVASLTEKDRYFDEFSYLGAFVSGVRYIHQAYPHIRLVMNTFTFCLAPDLNGGVQPGDVMNYGSGTLTDYYGRLVQGCETQNVSFIDNYMGFITSTNYEEYLTNGISLGVKARQYVAYHFALRIYPESQQKD